MSKETLLICALIVFASFFVWMVYFLIFRLRSGSLIKDLFDGLTDEQLREIGVNRANLIFSDQKILEFINNDKLIEIQKINDLKSKCRSRYKQTQTYLKLTLGFFVVCVIIGVILGNFS